MVALGLQRLLELRISRRNLRSAGSAPRASAATYPAMVVVHVALFATCLVRRRQIPRTVESLALAGLVVSTALRISAIRALGRYWNVSAHVDPSTRVVTSGPYRKVRHPNYTAVILEFACLPIAVGAVPEALILSLANAAVLIPRIRAEEALLDALPGYRAAFSGVPRFVPRPGRRSAGQIPASNIQSRTLRSPNPM